MKKSLKWYIAQYFEIRWWKNYLRDKDNSYIDYKTNYWKEFLNKVSNISYKDQEDILDIGCGPAGIYMIMNHAKVDAVDPLINDYNKEIDHFSKDNYPYVKFHSSAFEEFNIEKKYDKVFCLNAINHFSDLDTSLKKLEETAKEKAELFMSIDVHKSNFMKRFFKTFGFDFLHPHQFTLDDYIKMVENINFTIKEVIPIKKRKIFDYYLIVATYK